MSSSNNQAILPPTSSAVKKIPLYSPEFYAACAIGGVLSCGVTHTLVTPLDLVKCRRQVRSFLNS